MIRCIAVIDGQAGLGNKQGIPWQQQTPNELRFFRNKTKGGEILMGYHTYQTLPHALTGRTNYVLTHRSEPMHEGFVAVPELHGFLVSHPDVWVIGGAEVFSQVLGKAEELYLTQLEESFDCTVFFPEFHTSFAKISQSERQTENGVHYTYQTWRRKNH